jgi:branched-chain amino acid transport system ATP-binding protein
MAECLALQGVRSGYGQVLALQGVDLAVDDGECVVLLGANGAGKSTVLRTISGVVRTQHGAVRFRGKDIAGLKPHEIARLGIAHIPEGRGIFPGLSVIENLRLGTFGVAEASRRERASVERACALFPALQPKLNDTSASLSGGQQQMLAIARGLMSQPVLLMLDEPSLGLAPVLVDQVFQALHQIKSEGTTLLLVEQSAQHALTLADRGYVLNRGEVVQRGSASELRSNLHQAYLA